MLQDVVYLLGLQPTLLESHHLSALLNNMFRLNQWSCNVVHLVEALRYKPKGRGFDSEWSH